MSKAIQNQPYPPSPDATALAWIARRCQVSPSVARLIGELRGMPVPVSAEWSLGTQAKAIVERLSFAKGGVA